VLTELWARQWSDDHLVAVTGLAPRTIRRARRGQKIHKASARLIQEAFDANPLPPERVEEILAELPDRR
jgi:hypothetical protein